MLAYSGAWEGQWVEFVESRFNGEKCPCGAGKREDRHGG